MKEIIERSRTLDVAADYETATVKLSFSYKKNLLDSALIGCDGSATQVVAEGQTPLRGSFSVRADGDSLAYGMHGFTDLTFLVDATEAVKEVVDIITKED